MATLTPAPEAVALDTSGLVPELLDCYENNLQVMLRDAGVSELLRPFARDWSFRLPPGGAGAGQPALTTDPIEQRIREDCGYAPSWHSRPDGGSPAVTLARALHGHRGLLLMGDAHEMPWLPYAGRVHMDHSFLVTGADPETGALEITDAYHNDTQWGPARPVVTRLSRRAVEAVLPGGPLRFATLAPVATPAPPPLPAILGRSAAAISAAVADQGDLTRYVGRQGARLAGSATEVSLLCWLGVRSRTRFGCWLAQEAARRGDDRLARHASSFSNQVVPAWQRAAELAHLAERRALRDRPVPASALDQLAGPVRVTEAAAADRQAEIASARPRLSTGKDIR